MLKYFLNTLLNRNTESPCDSEVVRPYLYYIINLSCQKLKPRGKKLNYDFSRIFNNSFNFHKKRPVWREIHKYENGN